MIVISSPVSGGSFPCQIAIVKRLIRSEIKPDLMLGSSGGNIASYVTIMGDWSEKGINRICKKISTDHFIKKWSNYPIIHFILGFINGSFYDFSDGIQKLLEDNTSIMQIKRYEIWTGTYNRDLQKPQLMCNLSKEESIINKYRIDNGPCGMLDPIYMDSDLDLIAKSIKASACLPAVVPPQKIGKHNYIDGGTFSASPFTLLKRNIMKASKKKLHIIYINSCNIDDCYDYTSYSNIFHMSKTAVKELIRSQIISDRLSAYDCLIGDVHKVEFKCTDENLTMYKNLINDGRMKSSLLEIYPTIYYEMNITNFTGEEIIQMMDDADKCLQCRLWWVGDSDVDTCFSPLPS